MRFSTATGFVFYSTLFVYKRKLFKFLFCILIATWFHSFAAIGFFLYFIPYFAKPFLMWTILISSVLISAKGGIGLLMGNLLSGSGIAGIEGLSRIVTYMTSKYVHGYKTFGLTFISHIIFSALSLIFFKKLNEKWKYNTILIPMYIYGSSLFFLLNDYGILAARTQDLLCIPSIMVILPSFLLIFKKNERIVPYLLIVMYCVIFFAAQLINDSNASREYQSILQFI